MANEVDLANAEAELATAKAYRNKGGDLRDSNEGATTLGALRNEALEVAEIPVGTDRQDPSLLRILYHAYDGRVVPVPSFMAAKKLADRFPNESFIPLAWRGKRTWFLEPQATTQERLNLPCLLNENQSSDVMAEVRTAGVMPGMCTKNNIPSAFALEQHMRLKHKQEWAAIQRLRDRAREDARVDESRSQTAAILELAKSLIGQKEAK